MIAYYRHIVFYFLSKAFSPFSFKSVFEISVLTFFSKIIYLRGKTYTVCSFNAFFHNLEKSDRGKKRNMFGQEFLVTKAAIFNFKLSCSSNRFFAVKPPRRILHFPKLSGALPFFSHLDICLADIWRY